MSLKLNLVLSMGFLGGCLWLGRRYWEQLIGDGVSWPSRQWFFKWCIQGALVPVLVWVFLNSGLLGLPPLMPSVELARAGGGPWLGALADVTAVGVVVIGWSWVIVGLAWLIADCYVRLEAENRADFPGLMLVCAVFFLLPAAGLAYFRYWVLCGLCLLGWLVLLARMTLPQVPPPKPPPTYSHAIGKIKMDKYAEAEWAILRELDQCADDFQGWMLLAELYAVHFHDLAVADRTVHELCAQPNLDISQIDLAMHRLADWHLKLGDDPAPARRALEEICRQFLGTHADRMARQRLEQLPKTKKELLERRQPRKIQLRPTPDLAASAAPATEPEVSAEQASRQAAECVEQLRRDPNSVPARERLARLWAEQLGRVAQGIEQADLLLSLPDQPDVKRAEWLGWIARWQLALRHDPAAAREILELLVAQYPQTPQGFEAQRRLSLMAVEERFRLRRAPSRPRPDPP